MDNFTKLKLFEKKQMSTRLVDHTLHEDHQECTMHYTARLLLGVLRRNPVIRGIKMVGSFLRSIGYFLID
jgi:hypothetical protein